MHQTYQIYTHIYHDNEELAAPAIWPHKGYKLYLLMYYIKWKHNVSHFIKIMTLNHHKENQFSHKQISIFKYS